MIILGLQLSCLKIGIIPIKVWYKTVLRHITKISSVGNSYALNIDMIRCENNYV